MPLRSDADRLSDGRPVCAPCQITAIDDPVTARAIYEQVIQIVTSALGLRVYVRPGFALYSCAGMAALQEHIPHPEFDANTNHHLLGAYIKLGARREIVVETGLPRLMMTKVIAHEYGHAWQGENCPFLLDPVLLEGFCEWIAFRVLGVAGATEAQKYQRTVSGFYGDALRVVLAIEETGGASSVVSRVRSQARNSLLLSDRLPTVVMT